MSSQQTLPFAPSTSSQQASTSAVPAKTVKKPRTSKAKEEFDPTAGIYDVRLTCLRDDAPDKEGSIGL